LGILLQNRIKLKNLNRKLDRSQIEIELLRENRQKAGLAPLRVTGSSTTTTGGSVLSSKPSGTTSKDIKLTKRYYNLEEILADPIKTRFYIEKLNKQLKERDEAIRKLNESSNSSPLLSSELERCKLEIESLKEQLRASATEEQITHRLSSPRPIEREKNFSEIELDNVRSRLQKRLNELEPLPELLKNTELKLHDAQQRLKNYEAELEESKKRAMELKQQIERGNRKLNKDAASSARLDSARDQSGTLIENLTINKLEQPPATFEKRLLTIEEENRELFRQLSLKDDLIRDLTVG
jgi:chromosome segregation ATPase